MKLKFPKEITIGDMVFTVKTNPKSAGGNFSYPFKSGDKATIEIGTKHLKMMPTRVLSIIIHELKEIINVEQSVRFSRMDEEDNFEFHYTHKEHTDMCSRLAGLLNAFLK